jgi:prepilin-type N-terminal cleavage/methylation domain-containing protein
MKNKAYTLIELVVVIAILMTLSLATSVTLTRYGENKDYNEVCEKLYNHFRIFASEAENSESRIDIEFDFNNHLVLFKKEGKIISSFKLPKRYKYSNTGTNIHFNKTGNVSPMFTFEVKEGETNFFKMTFLSTDKFVQRVRIERKKHDGSNWIEF